MDAERLAQVEKIYHAVLEVSADERPSFLTISCGDDDELRREVESLLSYSNKPHSVIDIAPIDVAADVVRQNQRSNIIGKKIDRYEIISQIGGGGMGDVFLATDTLLERKVAVKFISAQFAQDAAGLKRFLREAKAASSLNHPNIITVHEIGKTKDTPYIATEYIEGKTLRTLLDNGGLSHGRSLDIAIQVASALIAAHSAGIYHRDIKPENIMLRYDKLVKVLDFGLAKIAGTPGIEIDSSSIAAPVDPELSSPGLMMGTLAYMSPEQVAGMPADARSDIWSLGVVMFEMISGRKPFSGTAHGDVIASISNDEPEMPDESIPKPLKAVISKMIAKDRDHRYQSASKLLVDLKELSRDPAFIADRETEPRSVSTAFNSQRDVSISSLEYAVGAVHRRKALAAAASLALVAIMVTAGYFFVGTGAKTISSIAVMPFENENGDPNADYLSDGMSEALINELSQFPDIKVIARGSAFKYKGTSIDVQQIARELGVQAIMTGKVSRRDDALQVTAELVNVADDSQMWGATFVRKPTEFAQIQTEILNQIIGRLGLANSNGEKQRLVTLNNADPQAYELLLKGRFFHSKGTEASARKAIEYYEQALAIDPNYALAHAAAASSHLYLGVNGFQDPKESMAKSETSARRAQGLNPDLAEVHLATAGIKQFSWNWTEAQHEYERAIGLAPNLASAHFRYSLFLSTQGRHDEALAEMREARELDPLKRGINLDIGFVLHFARRYDAALEQYAIGLELDPAYGGGYYGRGLINAAKGNYAAAIRDYREFIRLNGEHTGVNCYLGYALAKAGNISEAKAILRRLETGKEYVSPSELAILFIGLGENNKALDTLERAFAERDPQLQYLGIEPNFDAIRPDPRFIDLIRKVGLK